jgi:serine/threonine protein kinase
VGRYKEEGITCGFPDMARFHLLIRCIGEAVVAQGIKGLMGLVPFGDRLYEIASDAHGRYRQFCQNQEALAQVEAAARATFDEVKAEVRQVVAAVKAPEAEKNLASYLEQVPASIRSTLRRPADPTGRSVPRNFSLKRAEDFLRLLPPRPPRFRPGDRVRDGWVLSELLGVGGFGEVWKAEHASQPPVAFKFCLDDEAARYLRHEASLLDRLKSQAPVPGVVELRNVYLDSDPPCIAYEFVNGGDLCGLMHDWLLLTPARRFQLASQVILKLARIMATLHRLNPPLVHRDLKPANVLVVRKDVGRFDLKIGDFGLGGLAARKSLEAATRGVSRGYLLSQSLRGSHTPLYASPEQVRCHEPDPRDDVHALGVIWFQLLTGDLQKGAGPDFDEELRDLGVGEETIRVIKQCVTTRQERRFADCQHLAEQILLLPGVSNSVREATERPGQREGGVQEEEIRQREAEPERRKLEAAVQEWEERLRRLREDTERRMREDRRQDTERPIQEGRRRRKKAKRAARVVEDVHPELMRCGKCNRPGTIILHEGRPWCSWCGNWGIDIRTTNAELQARGCYHVLGEQEERLRCEQHLGEQEEGLRREQWNICPRCGRPSPLPYARIDVHCNFCGRVIPARSGL